MAELASVDSIRVPESVLRITETLEGDGFETWLVGGGVRDALMGHLQLDWDLATAARPENVQRLFRRTVPVGIRFGTVGVLDENGRLHEVTTFRRDVDTDGRHAIVEYGASLDEDLARRDFTINAIAFHPNRGLRDPYDGRADLQRGIVRAVGEPKERMREDRLRALRAIRFAARLGFRIEPATWDAIVASASSLPRLSPERVRQEIEKTMDQVRQPASAFRLWQSSGAMAALIPELDVSERVLMAMDCVAQPANRQAESRRLLRLAALFLDGSGEATEHVLRALRFPNTQAAWVAALVDQTRTAGADIGATLLASGTATDRDIRRWAAQVGRTRLAAVLRLCAADWSAAREGGARAPAGAVIRSVYRRAIRIAYRDPVQISDLAIDGHDLQALGVRPGPQIRELQIALLDRVLEDPLRNTRDTLLGLARQMLHAADVSQN